MISETKFDDSYPKGQLFIDDYHAPFRFDQNENRDEILLCDREGIPAKVIYCDFPAAESFYVEIKLQKKKWLINCSCDPRKNKIFRHLEVPKN